MISLIEPTSEPIAIKLGTLYGEEELRIDFSSEATIVSYSGSLERLREMGRRLPRAYSKNLGERVFQQFRDRVRGITQTSVYLEAWLSPDIDKKRIVQIPVYFLKFMQQL